MWRWKPAPVQVRDDSEFVIFDMQHNIPENSKSTPIVNGRTNYVTGLLTVFSRKAVLQFSDLPVILYYLWNLSWNITHLRTVSTKLHHCINWTNYVVWLLTVDSRITVLQFSVILITLYYFSYVTRLRTYQTHYVTEISPPFRTYSQCYNTVLIEHMMLQDC